MTQLLTECCNCRTDTDDLTADQAKAEGWVKARGVCRVAQREGL